MRQVAAALFGVLVLMSSALAAERRSGLEADECSKRTALCERQCEAKSRMDRLSCKTDCRLAETRCRNGQ